jgi:cell division transport system ATP-binding protein
VPAISFNQVGKRYPGGHDALAGVTLDVEPGEMVFLTGHSGAGKSTLLKLIPAIERPTHGVVLVNGQNVGRMRPAAIPYLRRNLGAVFQDQKLLHDRNAFENVMLPLAAAGLAPRDAAKRVRAALDKVGLLERERSRPVALSGGEQQRICIERDRQPAEHPARRRADREHRRRSGGRDHGDVPRLQPRRRHRDDRDP